MRRGGAQATKLLRKHPLSDHSAEAVDELLAALDFLLPEGLLERSLDILDKHRAVALVTPSGSRRRGNAQCFAVQASRAGRRPAPGSSSSVNPYIVACGSCTCPDFAASVGGQDAARGLVRARRVTRCGVGPLTRVLRGLSQCKHTLACAVGEALGTISTREVSASTLAFALVDAYRGSGGESQVKAD